jgi:hypothetical protein
MWIFFGDLTDKGKYKLRIVLVRIGIFDSKLVNPNIPYNTGLVQGSEMDFSFIPRSQVGEIVGNPTGDMINLPTFTPNSTQSFGIGFVFDISLK